MLAYSKCRHASHTDLVQEMPSRQLARYSLRRRKEAQKIAAGESAQFVRVPPTHIQLRNLHMMTEFSRSAAAHRE